MARFAGDEFVVVCPGLKTPEKLDGVLRRIANVVHAPDPTVDGPVRPRLSIGATLVRDDDTAADVLRRADEEMYVVKARG